MTVCDGNASMRTFAILTTAQLVAGAAAGINTAAVSPSADAVHKMRVSIRRLQQALRLFREFLPERGVKRVRKQLKQIMEPAGELRNHDIALMLLKKGGQDSPEMKAGRLAARQVLGQAMKQVAEPTLEARWRRDLGLDGDETVEA